MKYQVGDRVTGQINNITDLGIFLTLPGHKSGLVHHSDFGNNWLRQRNQLKVGDKLRVVVIHNHKGRLALSLSRVKDPDLIDQHNQFSKTAKQDFDSVLNQTLADAKTEIAKLETTLKNN